DGTIIFPTFRGTAMNENQRSRETLLRIPTPLVALSALRRCLAAALALGAAACGPDATGSSTGGGSTNAASSSGTSTTGTSSGEGSTGATSSGGTSTSSTSSGGGGAIWQVVDLVDDKLPDGTMIQHKGQSVVQGI